MKKICLLSSLLLFVVSCKTFKGHLVNNEDLILKAKKGSVTISGGERNIELTFKSKKKAELEIAGKTIEFKFSKDLKIPSNGQFEVKAKDWNQNYDLIGNSKTVVSVGPLSHDFESCVERIPYTVCDGKTCHVVYQDHYGTRHVEFRVETTVQDIEIELEKEGVDHATLTGANSRAERIYEYAGPCR